MEQEKNTPQNNQNQGGSPPVILTNEQTANAMAIDFINSLDNVPPIVNSQGIDVLKSSKKSQKVHVQNVVNPNINNIINNVQPPVSQPTNAVPVTPPVENKPTDVPVVDEGPEVVIETKFGKKVFNKKAVVDTPVIDESGLLEYAKTKGFNLKEVAELKRIIDEHIEVKSNYEKNLPLLEKYKQESENFNQYFQELPEEIQAIHTEYIKQLTGAGGDYKKVIKTLQSSPLDLTKDVNDFKELELVNAYRTRKYESDDWEDMDSEDRAEKVEMAKSKFITSQNQIKGQAEKFRKQQVEQRERYLKSVEDSITSLVNDEELKEMFGQLPQATIEEVREAMLGKFDSEMRNNDGTFKPSAAKKILLATNGVPVLKQTLESVSSIIEQQIEKRKNQELNRTTEQIFMQGTQDAPPINVYAEKSNPKEDKADKVINKVVEMGVKNNKFRNKN